MEKYRVAIVEDEDESANILIEYIRKYEEKAGCQIVCTRFRDGLEFITDYKKIYDVIFMDIRMPHYDGMQTSKELRKIDPTVAIIFSTNLRQYAIKGYEVNALDYIVKPLGYYDFEMKFVKAIDYAKRQQNSTIAVKMEDMTKILPLKEVYYIEVFNHRLVYHTQSGDFETYGQLSKVEEALRDKHFVRCSPSHLVNLQYVTEIYADYITVVSDKVPISRRKKKEFMTELTNYMGRGIL